ncbi:MAG: hydrolase [Ectothiorhodospira sp.]
MIVEGDFQPTRWLPGAHLQTIVPALLRPRVQLPLRRERLELPDGDFLDLDWAPPAEGPVILLLHGLEGSSRSPYAAGLMRCLHQSGFQGLTLHFRGCSGEPNRLARSYYAGDTGDIRHVVEVLKRRLPDRPLGAVGVSLGGNALLKWLGECGEATPLTAAAALSVPFDLDDAARRMEQGASRLYQRYLLTRLKRALARKARRMPLPVDPAAARRAHTFRTFDDAVTAPLHGFTGVDDYYARCSCRPYLQGIRTPTLILHARNDPFMTPRVIPTMPELSGTVRLELTDVGGHAGFVEGWGRYWHERRIPAWFDAMIGM